MALHSTSDLLEWIRERNRTTRVSIRKISLDDCSPWHYDEATGEIANQNRSFFRITGLQKLHGGKVILEQPVILQEEIGYLGILRRMIDGEMHYLMQAKIEPGNLNKIQLSPTIQATKSNFTQMHGGKKPPYLNYFINASKYKTIVDQIQSEQSSRFYKKRNRNLIIEVDEPVEVLPSHRFMTLAQIKELMRYDNLVNMDTRTVLSCLPIFEKEYTDRISDMALRASALAYEKGKLAEIYSYINDYKMFDEDETRFVPLFSLAGWEMLDGAFVCKDPYSFSVVFCDIEIEGREVRRWTQPLFEAAGIAEFALFTRERNGKREFLVKASPEVGCFDGLELGPSVQREFVHDAAAFTETDAVFDRHKQAKEGILFDVLLSEEGGRFYQEQNRNLVISLKEDELASPPPGYFWTSLRTLCTLAQVNNCLNIQLRNLISVLPW